MVERHRRVSWTLSLTQGCQLPARWYNERRLDILCSACVGAAIRGCGMTMWKRKHRMLAANAVHGSGSA
jgi:hypothetical protein